MSDVPKRETPPWGILWGLLMAGAARAVDESRG